MWCKATFLLLTVAAGQWSKLWPQFSQVIYSAMGLWTSILTSLDAHVKGCSLGR